jgi:hypothetical protein
VPVAFAPEGAHGVGELGETVERHGCHGKMRGRQFTVKARRRRRR